MKIHLQRELDALRKRVFHLCSLVEDNLAMAIQAVQKPDDGAAEVIRRRDREIDELEVQVEEECLKILALYHPVAADLRYLVSVLKLNADIERIGDLAVNIAGATRRAGDADMPAAVSDKLSTLASKSRAMLRLSLEALMDLDTTRARLVLAADDEVDALYHELAGMLQEQMVATPREANSVFCWLLAAKSMERVGDHATNIAEDTIYTVEGEIIRHGLG
ncbi:MAG: phosphate signaling complex protein PhoU [bacterium]|jgi:phosphate transport system protein|nr:phosphate signaling complex protein PhoU [bacterium]MBK9776818.1 phosphate signaling complex protein PhoU [bacterium]